MFLSQIQTEQGRVVVARVGEDARIVPGAASVVELAQAAIAATSVPKLPRAGRERRLILPPQWPRDGFYCRLTTPIPATCT